MASVWKSRVAVCSLAAVVGSFGGVGSASAADLGGNCCADLEERIAELEATTVRKGNRKVSLEVSGHVNEAILFWDDGSESNVGVYTNDNARTRFRMKGSAKIDGDWRAGYLLEVGVRGSNSKRFNQDLDNAATADNNLDLRHSTWYIENKKIGAVWVGLTGGATESVTEVNLAATKDILKYSDQEDTGLGLFMNVNGIRTAGTPVQWRQLIRGGGDQPGEGRRHNLVRLDTADFSGFKASASWGEDDSWTAGLRYSGEIGDDIKIAAAIAYGATSDASGETGMQCVGNNANNGAITAGIKDADCEQVGGSISVMHVPSGIYANFAAGYMKDNVIGVDPGALAIAGVVEDRSVFYAGEVGIEKKWNALGKTTVFGQYYYNNGGSQDRTFTAGLVTGDIVESELTSFGAGVIQGIDAAAMHVYLTYRHYQADVNVGATRTKVEADDLDVVMGGAIIRY